MGYTDDHCLLCGAYVPEGTQVCHACSVRYGQATLCGTIETAERKGEPALSARKPRLCVRKERKPRRIKP